MQILKTIAVVLVSVFSLSMTPVHEHQNCHGFLPENDMNIPVEDSFGQMGRNQKAGGLTEQEFNQVISNVERLYKDQIKSLGGNLVIKRLWDSGKVNAVAEREGDDWVVSMFGGLARVSKMTPDGFAMVVCHELGHHIGGAKKLSVVHRWATNEGGADYFASTKCIRKYFELDSNNQEQLKGEPLELIAVEACKNQFNNDADRLICARSMLAGKSLAHVLKGMDWFGIGFGPDPKFSTPDSTKVMWTNDRHPNAQCRLDTYFNGSLCTMGKDSSLSDTDYRVGTCTALTHKAGLRPRCWFKPQE